MKYVFGNWKMYLNYEESVNLAAALAKEIKKIKGLEMAVFPTALAMVAVKNKLSKAAEIGAQNCAWTPKGAYTGAISAQIYKAAGCRYALVGHSERRHIFGESHDATRKKLAAALEAGLIPVLCVGETKEDRTENKVQYRLKKQLATALSGLNLKGEDIIIAYEPVWAIGTGNPCQPSDADDVHGWIKMEIKQYIKGEISVLDGGSVNAENVVSYVSLDTVDGVLVGAASAKFDSFVELIRAVELTI